jgi:hypothetical protein
MKVFDFIEGWYNPHRHSTLGQVSRRSGSSGCTRERFAGAPRKPHPSTTRDNSNLEARSPTEVSGGYIG